MSKLINLDDVFRSGLRQADEPFDEHAWQNMQNRLAADAVKPKFLLSFLTKNTIIMLSVILSLSLVITSFFWLHDKPEAKMNISSVASLSGNITNALYAISIDDKLNTFITPVSEAALPKYNQMPFTPKRSKQIFYAASASSGNPSGNDKNNNSVSTEGVNNKTTEPAPRQAVSRIENTRIVPKFKKGKIKKTLKPVAVEHRPSTSSHYDCATMGLHLHYLQPLNTYASIGQKPGLGFDLEGYSQNLAPDRFCGLFLGGSASIAWMGKSKKTDIILNTPNSDAGRTFLRNYTCDVNFIGRLEFGKGDIKFYATGFGGWRCIFISQEIQSKKQIDGFDNSSKNVWNKSMLQWGGGIGIRYHFMPGVSLDVRGMYEDVDFMHVANVRKSVYDEFKGKYDLKSDFIQPRLLSIKIGLQFCFDQVDTHHNYGYDRQGNNPRIYIPMPTLPSGGGKSPVQIKVPGVGK